MLRHLFMNGGSLKSLMLFEGENDTGADDRAALRAKLASGVNVSAKSDNETVPKPAANEVAVEEDENEEDENEEEPNEEDAPELDADGNPVVKVEETAEEKTAREAKEAEEGKNKRKEERIQKRIDKAHAAQKAAETELARVKALLDAKPADEKLTEEEVQSRAEAIAKDKLATAELGRIQKEFTDNCDKLQDAAEKLDKDFIKKAHLVADEIGPLPNEMLNVLFDIENGADVLNFLVNDVDEAEKIYDLIKKPARLGIALSKISDKLAEAKKPKHKVISKVPDAIKPVNGVRVQSTQITSNDTSPEGMENYIRKRKEQRAAALKARNG